MCAQRESEHQAPSLHRLSLSGQDLGVRAQQHVMISNAVTVGATVLNNNSATYASFAILMDQTLARQVCCCLIYCCPALHTT